MGRVAILGRLAGATAIAAVLVFPAAAAGAKPNSLGDDWASVGTDTIFNLTEDDSNLSEIGLERTEDGVLHVLWFHNTASQAVVHSIFTGTDPDSPGTFGAGDASQSVVRAFPENGQSLNPSVDLIRTAEGGLRAFFAGLFPNQAIDGVMATATAPQPGTQWSTPVAASATAAAQRSPVYAASGIGAAIDNDGLAMSSWGDSSPTGGGYHVGLNTNVADLRFSDACCEIDPNLAVDSESGETMVAANLIDNGIQIKSLDTGQSFVAPDSTAAWTQQRTSISGRLGAPGIWIAYGSGDNMFNARPALWEVGAAKFSLLKNQHDAAHVGMAPAPDGRMWLYWDRDGRVFASRTDPSGQTFGSVVSLPTLNDSPTIYRLNGEGSLGTLDVFALTEQGDHLEWSVERVPPGLKLKAKDDTVQPGQKIGFKVTDAGEPVEGARVLAKVGNDKLGDTTDAGGEATLKIPGNASKGKETAEAEKTGYAHDGNKDRVAKFKITG